MAKKITRGISREFAHAFKKSELWTLYNEHKDELLIGVRNEYLNLYYDCASIAKITYNKLDKKIVCTIHKKYIERVPDNDAKVYVQIDPGEIYRDYKDIKIKCDTKNTQEKKAQSKLVLLNNANERSNWYCIDIEYKKAFPNKAERDKSGYTGRFDIIALSKTKPRRLAVIELKYGSKAMGGKSGVHKHAEDFFRLNDNDDYKQQFKLEIIDVVHSLEDLGIPVPFAVSDEQEIGIPEFYFITLNNNAKKNASTPMQTMAGYLFNDKRWGCKELTTERSVENDFGDITRKDNGFSATFLFSKSTIENITIKEIIDGVYDERIIPV